MQRGSCLVGPNMPEQLNDATLLQRDSLLPTIEDIVAWPFVWVPSPLPAGLVPLYTRSCTAYNDAAGTTTMRV